MRFGQVLLAVIFIATSAQAQQIQLNVHVSEESGLESLAGAVVRLRIAPNGPDVTSRTGIDGWARISLLLDPVGVPDLPGVDALRLLPQPWPNPLTATGLIPYRQPSGKDAEDGDVTLYDLRGRALAHARLSAGELDAGASGLPAGVYVLRCVARASGQVSNCRVVVDGSRLRHLRFVAVGGAPSRRDPVPHGWPAQLEVRYPDHQDHIQNLTLVEGNQDLEVQLAVLGGTWPLRKWLFASNHGWNAAAVDSGWVPAIADTAAYYDRCLIDTDGTRHALARWNANNPPQEFCSTSSLWGGSSGYLLTGLPAAAVIWYDLQEIPAGVSIESAYLIVSPAPGSRIPCPAGRWHAAVLDIWNSDAAWLAAPISESCGSAPGREHWRRTSWQYVDAAAQIPWDLPLGQRAWWEDFGIKSVPLTAPVEDGQSCRYDVTRAVQAWSDHRGRLANAGFVLANSTPPTAFVIACGPAASSANRQPLLVVNWSQRPHAVPWHGYPLALSFGTDDGDTANLRYTQICDQHGVGMTVFVMRRGVRDHNPTNFAKIRGADLRSFLDRGHEVGHHSDNHLVTWGLAEITWGDVDSMNVELARDTWLEQLFNDGGQTTSQINSFAYPAGGVSLWAIKNLQNHGFQIGRGDNSGEIWGQPPWGGSGWSTYLSWYDPVNIFSVAVVGHAEFFGYNKSDNYDYATIRAKLRRYAAVMLNQGQAALLTSCHSTKASTTYPYGIDYDELDWFLTAAQESELFWIAPLGEIAGKYRDTHLAVAPGDGIGIAAYDSLVQTGNPEFLETWWVPTETSQ